MGKGHDHKRRHSFVLIPMFCRLSIKDVRFSHTEDGSDDPSSPKVSCMGQVRRKNRVIGFNAAAASSSAATRTNYIQHSHNYKKLITMFSSRNLVPATTTNNAGVSSGCRRGSKSCRTSREMISASNLRMTHLKKYDHDDFGDPGCVEAVIDVGEMDPPLPVMKRVTPPAGGVDEVNIWKRRFNGVALKGLQIDQIHLSKIRFLPPTTVG